MKTFTKMNFFRLKPFVKYFSEENSDLKSRLIKNSLLYVNKLGFNPISFYVILIHIKAGTKNQ